MNTIDTSMLESIHCNRCGNETYHHHRGQCQRKDEIQDDGVSVNFLETYALMQCGVCGQARLRVVHWNSENESSSPVFFPKKDGAKLPTWAADIADVYRQLLLEVYSAKSAGLNAISLMGIRAILDVWVETGTSDTPRNTSFPKRLAKLAQLGTLSARQVEALHVTFEAGSASAHRGFLPRQSHVDAAIESIEIVLQQEALLPRIGRLKNDTPERPM